MSYIKVNAIILGSYETIDKSKNIIALTDKLGKTKIKFKAAKSSNSKRSGFTYDYVLEKILLYKKNEYYIATEIELINAFESAKDSLRKAKFLYYIKELLIILVQEEQSDEKLFQLLKTTLILLNNSIDERNVFLFFVLNFFSIIGVPIKINHNLSGNYYFDPSFGGFNERSGIRVSKEVFKEIEKFSTLNIIEIQNFKIEHFDEILRLINSFSVFHANSKHLNDFIEEFEKEEWGER